MTSAAPLSAGAGGLKSKMPTITAPDLLKLEQDSGIDQLTAERFDLRRVDTVEGAALVGRNDNEDYAGIVFPVYWPGDPNVREYFLRRDHPSIENGKPKGKYLAPPGRSNKLLFGPGEPVEALTDPTRPIVLVEGLKKLVAGYRLARYECDHPRFLPCAISGVYGYRGVIGKTTDSTGARVNEQGVIADFSRIIWTGRNVVVVFDSDCATNEKVGAARRGLLAELRKRGAKVSAVDLPNLDGLDKTGFDDFLARRGPEAVLELIHKAITSHTSEPPSSGGFAPVSLVQLLDEPEPLEPEWTLEDILAVGILAAIVSKPKVGKTTLVYELAVAVAHGWMFLGRNTKRGNVLILAVEEHRRDVKRRLRNLGAGQLDSIHVHAGPLSDSPDTIYAMAAFIKQHAIVLVIIDTLNSFWSVTDENDAGAVTKAIKPLLQLARESGATVLLIHHARKAEGDYGDEIRGSGALFSLLDVAMVLKRDSVDTQRRFTIISRYAESPPELLLELQEQGYVSLGDPVKHSKTARLTQLVDALTDTPMKVEALATKAKTPVKASYALLELLAKEGKATRSGTGKRGAPFLYSRFVSLAALKDGGPEETNSHPSTPPAQEIPPDPEFVASGVQPLEGETKRNGTNKGSPGTDSFLPTPVPPGSNESNPKGMDGTPTPTALTLFDAGDSLSPAQNGHVPQEPEGDGMLVGSDTPEATSEPEIVVDL